MCEYFHSTYFAGARGLGDPLDSTCGRLYASSKPSRLCLGMRTINVVFDEVQRELIRKKIVFSTSHKRSAAVGAD
ncbi:hypothetical protein GCM10009085_16330 [Pseudomonas avellanae]|nr:hypothetical protein GCM10009085_16330 [Pseudomonas avellanae]